MLRSAEDDQPFELRLAQAVAWCTRLSKSSLRSEHLRPWVLESNRASTIRHVLERRAYPYHRGVRVDGPVRSRADLKDGELLLYFPDANLADGAAEAETGGVFDVENAPPWDTWVGLFRDGPTDVSFSDYLISYVPADLVTLVQRGIDVNPEECILWLRDTRVPLADALRTRDLLG